MTGRIISGSHYTYNASLKQIWLSYEFYDLTVENIFLIRNLTKNKLIYHCKNPQYSIEVVGGCITHSYPGTDDAGDKLQIILNTPIADSLEELTATDGVVTVSTAGKVLVLPSGNSAVLPSFNEYVLNSNRLTIAESPFGGLKGAGSPDYNVGTLFCQTDGVYLTDVNGNNSTKTLTAGKQKEIGTLSVDTVAHSITQEFIIANTSASNSPTVIDTCDSATGWHVFPTFGGTISSITVENERLKVIGTSDGSGRLIVEKTISSTNLSNYPFLSASIESSVAGYVYFVTGQGSNLVRWSSATAAKNFIAISQNTNNRYTFPIKAPVSVTNANPTNIDGTVNFAAITYIRIGIIIAPNTACTFYIDNIAADVAKSAYIELQTTNDLAEASMVSQKWTGSTYETNRILKLDSTASVVSADTTKMVFNDQTKFDDVFGTGLGRSNFPKGSAGDTKSGTLAGSQITYSSNAGADKRVGFMVSLPPSDGGRTAFNQIRFKIITYYTTDADGKRAATFNFADNTNTSYGLQNWELDKPWLAMYDPTSNLIDIYRFTHRPQNLSFKRDESGVIYELSLYPGAGSVYHGQITYAGLTTDSNSDYIPDCLEASINNSVTNFLKNYSMVIDE